MQTLNSKIGYIIIAIILITFAGCVTPDANENFAVSNGIAKEEVMKLEAMEAIDSMLYADGNYSSEVAAALKGMMQKSIDKPDAFWAEMEEKGNNVIYITPNPTSLSVTVEFLHGQGDVKFPELALDLYFENHKLRTITYANVGKSVKIPEGYLQQAEHIRL
jgi:hypothetical protein